MEPNFEEINCNICQADNYEKISNKGKNGLPTNLVLCKECGLGYLNPRWDKESYMHFYRYEYDKFYRPEVLSKNDLETNEKNAIIQRFSRLESFPSTVQHILDIGSGEGMNLNDLKSIYKNSSIYAIEPSVDSHQNLTKIGAKIISDDVDKDWDKDYNEKFELIIMRHVLEHFMDPLEIMKKVKSVLSVDGILYVAVPNNLNPTSNLRTNWFRNVHTYYFNKHSLRNLLSLAGLEIVHMIEGDEMNRGEVYLMAKRSEKPLASNVSKKHFDIQNTVFVKKLRIEAFLLTRLCSNFKRKLQRIIN